MVAADLESKRLEVLKDAFSRRSSIEWIAQAVSAHYVPEIAAILGTEGDAALKNKGDGPSSSEKAEALDAGAYTKRGG